MSFVESYDKWDFLSLDQKKQAVVECAKLYESKAVAYILAGFSYAKRQSFKKEPLVVRFVMPQDDVPTVSFGNNEIFVETDGLEREKKALFYAVAQNSVCAVFLHLFSNTSSNPNKKTSFGKIASGYTASITGEFTAGSNFEQDMMEAIAMDLDMELSMGE